MLAMAEWSLAYAMEWLGADFATKLFWIKIEYFGIVSVPVFWLIFSLEYTGRRSLLTWRSRAVLFLIPLITVVLVWTNQWHKLIWQRMWIDTTGGLHALENVKGACFWVFAAYAYVLMLAGTILIGREVGRVPALYRRHARIMLIGILFPWLGNIIYLSGFNPLPGLDWTLFAFIPTGMAAIWGITRYRFLETIPLAHDVILQHLHDGVLVSDSRGRVLYLNPAAEQIFNFTANQIIGQPVQEFFTPYTKLVAQQLGKEKEHFELLLEVGGESRWFEVHISPVYTSAQRRELEKLGHLILFDDIGARQQAEIALQHRDSFPQFVSLVGEKFLRMGAWEQSVPEVLAQLGKAAETSRVFVFERHLAEDGTHLASLRYEWAAAGISPKIDDPALQNLAYQSIGLERWDEVLGQCHPRVGLARGVL